MRPSDELFKLIHSLSKSEKRFFRITSNQLAGEKNYVKLFDFIGTQENYDEEAIKKEFFHKTIARHLPYEKHYLYQQILKSLRAYHNQDNINTIIQQGLQNIEILHNKALYKECNKQIEKVKKLSLKYEKFHYLNEIIAQEHRLIEEAIDQSKTSESIDILTKETEQISQQIINLNEFQTLYSRINHVFKIDGFLRHPNSKKQVEQIAQHPLIAGEKTAISIRAQSMKFYIRGVCAICLRHFGEGKHFFSQTKELLDKYIDIKKELNIHYILCLIGLIYCSIAEKKYSETQQIINQLKKLNGTQGFDTVHAKNWVSVNVYTLELILLQRIAQFKQSIQLIRSINLFIANNYAIVGREHRTVLLYYQAVSYFAVGDLKKAISLTNEAINQHNRKLRQDIHNATRMLNIILHYESKNYDYVTYISKSVDRHLQQQGKDLYVIELAVIRHIGKLIKETDEWVLIDLWLDFDHQIQALLIENPALYVINEYFHLQAWINSKLNKTTYQEECQKSVEREA